MRYHQLFRVRQRGEVVSNRSQVIWNQLTNKKCFLPRGKPSKRRQIRRQHFISLSFDTPGDQLGLTHWICRRNFDDWCTFPAPSKDEHYITKPLDGLPRSKRLQRGFHRNFKKHHKLFIAAGATVVPYLLKLLCVTHRAVDIRGLSGRMPGGARFLYFNLQRFSRNCFWGGGRGLQTPNSFRFQPTSRTFGAKDALVQKEQVNFVSSHLPYPTAAHRYKFIFC